MPAKKTTTTIESFISARLVINRKTPPKNTGEYSYELETLHVDKYGHIIANAGGNDVFICTHDELPLLIAFLQSLVSK